MVKHMATRDDNSACDEVRFSELHSGDVIQIETENNLYTLEITDATRRMGVLGGGVVGTGREVVVSGSVLEQEFYGEGLKCGARALFFTLDRRPTDGFNRLVTSQISAIRAGRGGLDQRAA